MIDEAIVHPLYRHAKDIVDRLIIDEDFKHSDELYHDDRASWLEVLRVAYAYYMASTSTKPRSEKILAAQIDPAGIQQWLDWVKAIQDGGVVVDEFGRETRTCDHYRKSPGIKRWKSFSAMRHDGSVRGDGKKAIYFDRLRGRFSTEPLFIDGTAEEAISRRIDAALKQAGNEGFTYEIRGGEHVRRTVAKIVLTNKKGIKCLVWHSPFSYEDQTLEECINLSAATLAKLGPLKKNICTDVVNGGWPQDEDLDIFFHVTPKTESGEDLLDLTVSMGIEQVGHDLAIHEDVRYLFRFKISREATSADIHEQYKTGRPYHSGSVTFINQVRDAGRIEGNKLKRRRARSARFGDGKIEIDKVAAHLLELIKQNHPDKREKILSGKTVTVRMPVPDFNGFVTGRRPKAEKGEDPNPRRTKESVSFNLEEGRLRVRVHLSDNAFWNRNRLLVHGLPQTVLTSLAGKRAREIFDHPIADLLGTVRSAYPVKRRPESAWISFNPVEELITIKESS